jgi:hypothetical protein
LKIFARQSDRRIAVAAVAGKAAATFSIKEFGELG